MNARNFAGNTIYKLLAAGVVCFVLGFATNAQVQTETKVEHGPTTQSVNVERGEVVTVSGNSLVVKMEDGEIRDFPNVPDSVKITVDGKELSVHDLKPGMKLERATIISTTPRMVTTTSTVTGRVFHVTPPNSVILTLQNNTNQRFQIPAGTKFTVGGQETNAWGLRRGMNVTATAITEVPEIVSSHEVKRTGTMPPPPPAPAVGVPILILVGTPVPATEAAAEPEAPAKLPKTASDLPLIGALGLLFCVLAFTSRKIRMRISHT
jgi:hypothetical protein